MNSNATAIKTEADFPGSGNETIVQFWDADVPDYVQLLLDSVTAQSRGVDYELFDDERARQLLLDDYGREFAEIYDNCAIPAMRSDFFRYCYLCSYGGLYVDADFRCVRSLQGLMDMSPRGLMYRMMARNGDLGIVNNLIYFRQAGDPLAQRFVDTALDNIRRRVSNNVWTLTGPAVMRAVLEQPEHHALADGMTIIDDACFAEYLEPVVGLEYKRTDTHWFTAKENGVSPFRDAAV